MAKMYSVYPQVQYCEKWLFYLVGYNVNQKIVFASTVNYTVDMLIASRTGWKEKMNKSSIVI